jgi:hypothetical protein
LRELRELFESSPDADEIDGRVHQDQGSGIFGKASG